jgi:hypothetical protein
MNDIAACWFWRWVDLRFGAFEMFEHPSFTGIRNTIFLAEWESKKKHVLPGWHMNDSMTSIKWHGVPGRASVKLYEHPDGSGNNFNRAVGWSSEKEVDYLPNYGFNDNVSAFEWFPVIPVKEIVESVSMNISGGSPAPQGQRSETTVTNKSDVEQVHTVTLENTFSETFTVTTSETQTGHVTSTATAEASGGVKGIGEVTFTIGIEVGYEYSKSTTDEKSKTTEVKVSNTQQITAKPGG